uniref:Uncharacterized protein n=1 Tax=Rhizophora mucronata TaxID=61149 RepID=A0A2P2P4W1_RHIMU
MLYAALNRVLISYNPIEKLSASFILPQTIGEIIALGINSLDSKQ